MANFLKTETDKPWKFHEDATYPRRIFLSTVLRWALSGYGVYNPPGHIGKVNRINDEALATVGNFLAQHIGSGAISIYGAHTMLPLAATVQEKILARLRVIKWRNELPEHRLVDDDGLHYHVDGMQLYQVVTASIPDIDQVWRDSRFLCNLRKALPKDWRDKLPLAQVAKDTSGNQAGHLLTDSSSAAALPGGLTDSTLPPGKLPLIGIGKLAIKAAWEIECATKKRASDREVMNRLQHWADNGDEPAVLKKSDKNNRHVVWTTNKSKEKYYTLEACQKTLEAWNKSRQ